MYIKFGDQHLYQRGVVHTDPAVAVSVRRYHLIGRKPLRLTEVSLNGGHVVDVDVRVKIDVAHDFFEDPRLRCAAVLTVSGSGGVFKADDGVGRGKGVVADLGYGFGKIHAGKRRAVAERAERYD